MPHTESLIIRRSPFVIIKNLILWEFLATGAYFLLGILGNYGEIYQELNVSQIFSYEIARFLFVVLAELAIVVFIFLRWMTSAYRITPEKLVFERGIFFKRTKAIALHRPLSVSCMYGPLSKLLKYGTLAIRDAAMKRPVVLRHVPNPKTYLRLIMEQEKYLPEEETPDAASLGALLRGREHEKLEFKSSLRWDFGEKRINKGLEKMALKTIAAFLNTNGGHLVIGVSDNREILGLAHDYRTLTKQDADGFETHFTHVFNEAIGPEFRQFVKLSFRASEDQAENGARKELCVIRTLPAAMPAYMKSSNEEVFYIRTGNSTTPLQVSEVAKYVRARWG